jgi:hypothetical protein
MSQAGTIGEGGEGPGGTDLHVARIIVGVIGEGANYSTIAAGVAAANAVGGGTVYIQDGSYTENLTIPDDVNLTSSINGAGTNSSGVTIIGTLTFGSTGATLNAVNNIRLVSNGAPIIVCEGTLGLSVGIVGCFLDISGGVPGIQYSNTHPQGELFLYTSNGDISDTATQLFQMTGTGFIIIDNCNFTNSNGTGQTSTNPSTISSGTLTVYSSEIPCAVTSSLTGSVLYYSNKMDNENTTNAGTNNQTWLTIGGSGNNLVDGCYFNSGTASAISVGSSLTLSNSTILSSNTNSITGAGSISISACEFTGSSSTINTTTQVPLNLELGLINGGGTLGQVLTSNGPTAFPTYKNASGSMVLISSQTASSSASLLFTGMTNAFDQYMFIWYGVTISGTDVVLQLQYSTNSGSSFITTGYVDQGFLCTETSLFQNFASTYAGVPLTTFANTSTTFPAAGTLRIDQPSNTTFNKTSFRTGYEFQSSTGAWTYEGSANYNTTTTAVNSFQILPSAGNITTGHFKLFGIVN